MDSKFIKERISSLRLKKGLSEYKMSVELGHSKSYVQSISSGKASPSLTEFLYICDYPEVSPKEFFDTKEEKPQLVHALFEHTKGLSADDILLLISLADRLRSKNPLGAAK